jgi:hypothetical protein
MYRTYGAILANDQGKFISFYPVFFTLLFGFSISRALAPPKQKAGAWRREMARERCRQQSTGQGQLAEIDGLRRFFGGEGGLVVGACHTLHGIKFA